jgi:hypothetical protein
MYTWNPTILVSNFAACMPQILVYTPFGNGEGRGSSVCPSFDVRPSHHWNFLARMPQIYHSWPKIVTELILISNSAACMPQILPLQWLRMYTVIWNYTLLSTNYATCMPQILPLDWLHLHMYTWINKILVIKFCGMHAADSTIRLVTLVYIYMN